MLNPFSERKSIQGFYAISTDLVHTPGSSDHGQHCLLIIGVGRFRILGGGARFRIWGGGMGGQNPIRHMTSY